MNQFDHLYLGRHYAVFAPNKRLLSVKGEIVEFRDGSSANLFFGSLVDTSTNPDEEFILIKLAEGINQFKLGHLNENPQQITGKANEIELNYPGVVEVLPSPTDQVTVTENQYCHAQITDGKLVVSRTNYMELTYIHQQSDHINFTSMSNSKNNATVYPILQIFAPSNVDVTGKTKALKYTKVNDIKLNTGIVSGDFANNIDITSTGSVTLDCPQVSDQLCVKTTGRVTSENQIQCQSLTIETNGAVDFKKPVVCNQIIINTNSTVNFIALFSSTATLEGNGQIQVDQGFINNLTVKSNSRVNITLIECPTLKVDTNRAVSVNISSKETEADIKTNGKVTTSMAIAKKITIKTNDKVETFASVYLSEPKVSTNRSYTKNTI